MAGATIPPPVIRFLGEELPYARIEAEMRSFTAERKVDTPDEFWCLSHAPVFTQGLNGQPEHLLDPGAIPVVPTDRGGQVTYHGPGQLVVYTLVDLARAGIGVRDWVERIEQVVIDWLGALGVTANREADAPGVYLGEAKIAALGLKVRRGRCYHGLSLNLDMDLSPFDRINPCGVSGRVVTQLSDRLPAGVPQPSLEQAGREIAERLAGELLKPKQPMDPR